MSKSSMNLKLSRDAVNLAIVEGLIRCREELRQAKSDFEAFKILMEQAALMDALEAKSLKRGSGAATELYLVESERVQSA